jgi:uncharacterized protein (DUF362 family)
MMDRRRFLGAAAVAGTALALGKAGRAAGAEGVPDLVAVRNGEPGAMFDRAIRELGGMKAFVKKGQKVLVKPNIGWDQAPETGATTHPQLVARIVEQALAAGAKEVFVFDNSCSDNARAYRASGIAAAARAAGAKVAPGGVEGAYHPVKVKGKSLTEAKVHELFLEADVFVNVPILKLHGSAAVTAGMKNLMGVVWDRQYWHAHDLPQCIADMAGYRRPDLTVVDAYRVMVAHGPRGGAPEDVQLMKMQLLSTDPVAVDMAGSRLLFRDPLQIVAYLPLAAKAGLGRMDLDALDIRRITL